MALYRKFDALHSLRPDVAVISECAEPARLRRKLGASVLGSDPIWFGSNGVIGGSGLSDHVPLLVKVAV